jgi:hypothetical protein
MKKLIISILALAFIGLSACKKKETNNYKITGSDYTFTQLNNCELSDGGANGSSLNITLYIENPDYNNIYGIKTWFEGDKKDKNEEISRVIDLLFHDNEVTLYRCLRFGNLNSGTYTVTVVTMDGLESVPYSFKVVRPGGAN